MKTESRRYIKSSSFIMALLFTVLCGAVALSLGYLINYFAKGHFIHSTEAVLDAEIRYIKTIGPQQARAESPEHIYLLLDKNGSLPSNIPAAVTRLAEGIIVFEHPDHNRRYAGKVYTFESGQKMLIGTDITSISKDFRFMQLLGIASIIFVMAVVFVAYIISVFVVSGTNKIATTANDIISTGDLSRRVDVGSRWDDLSNMAAALNRLLDRIQELMRDVRQVSDNIAHDLRTPLTRMRSKLETLKDDDNKNELLDETDQLLSTFNALLRISRIETEKKRSQFMDVDLTALLEDVAAFYEPLAEEKGITLISSLTEAYIHGDRNLLFQAYANLLDNAVKFTPTGGTVSINLYSEKQHIMVEICDSGTGIPELEKDKIFNRFFRSEKSRRSSGTGLGLSLVKAVINLHSGDIQVKNTNPGLKIITIL